MANFTRKKNKIMAALLFICSFSCKGSEVVPAEDSLSLQSPRFSETSSQALPFEIVEHISAYLPEKDYKSLADSCVYMRSILLDKKTLLHRLRLIAKAHLADERLVKMTADFNRLWPAGTSMAQRIADTQRFHAEYLTDIKSLWYTVVFYFRWLGLSAGPDQDQYFCRSNYFDMYYDKMKPGYSQLNLPILAKPPLPENQYASLNLLFYFHALGRCENIYPVEEGVAFLKALDPMLCQFNQYNMDLCYDNGWENRHLMLIWYAPPAFIVERQVVLAVMEN